MDIRLRRVNIAVVIRHQIQRLGLKFPDHRISSPRYGRCGDAFRYKIGSYPCSHQLSQIVYDFLIVAVVGDNAGSQRIPGITSVRIIPVSPESIIPKNRISVCVSAFQKRSLRRLAERKKMNSRDTASLPHRRYPREFPCSAPAIQSARTDRRQLPDMFPAHRHNFLSMQFFYILSSSCFYSYFLSSSAEKIPQRNPNYHNTGLKTLQQLYRRKYMGPQQPSVQLNCLPCNRQPVSSLLAFSSFL